MVGGKWQLKVVLPGEVTIEYTEHVGGLFSSVWNRGGLGILGVTIWSFPAFQRFQSSNKESQDFYYVYIDVFDMLDVDVRCACGLDARGPGKMAPTWEVLCPVNPIQ